MFHQIGPRFDAALLAVSSGNVVGCVKLAEIRDLALFAGPELP